MRMNVWRALSVLVLVAGCSSISTNFDYDPSADFTVYKTYAWISQPTNVSGSAQQAQGQNALIGKRIMNSVDGVLATKGLTMSDDPQLLAVYHTGVQDKVEVTDYGYGYGGYGGWYGGGYGGYSSGVDVYQYKEGTLIVDFVDAASKQLVWRGTAQGAMASTPPGPEEMQAKIDNVVGRLLQNFPPPAKKK
jgi:hypothetical protein